MKFRLEDLVGKGKKVRTPKYGVISESGAVFPFFEAICADCGKGGAYWHELHGEWWWEGMDGDGWGPDLYIEDWQEGKGRQRFTSEDVTPFEL